MRAKFPLTPYQRVLVGEASIGFGEPVLGIPVQLGTPLSMRKLKSAATTCLTEHPMLRSAILYERESGLQARIRPMADDMLEEAFSSWQMPPYPPVSYSFDVMRDLPFRVLPSPGLSTEITCVVPHAISDARSVRIIGDTFREAYLEQELALSDSALPFADYALRISEMLSDGRVVQESARYWETVFHDTAPVCFAPVHLDGEGHLIRWSCGETLSGAIVRMAKNCRTTLFSYLLACLQTAIWNSTDAKNYVVHSLASTRSQQNLDTVGCFLGEIAVSARRTIGENKDLRELSRILRAQVGEALSRSLIGPRSAFNLVSSTSQRVPVQPNAVSAQLIVNRGHFAQSPTECLEHGATRPTPHFLQVTFELSGHDLGAAFRFRDVVLDSAELVIAEFRRLLVRDATSY